MNSGRRFGWEPPTKDSTSNSTDTPMSNSVYQSAQVQTPAANHISSFNASNAVTPMSSPSIVSKYPIPILPSAGLTIPAIPANNTVPEFLYQLTKMLTGGHKEIIEWSNGKIEVHNPSRLQNEVLSKYFRHSKFASFQRQLNYFGFRKIAGKGKMAPCSYVNEAVTTDIGSLLLIKRKTTTTAPRDKNAMKTDDKQSSISRTAIKMSTGKLSEKTAPKQGYMDSVPVNSNSSNDYQSQNGMTQCGDSSNAMNNNVNFAIAKSAVGKGVSHGYNMGSVANPLMNNNRGEASAALDGNNFLFPPDVEESLSQLTNNFQNSLNEAQDRPEKNNNQNVCYGFQDPRLSSISLDRLSPSMSPYTGMLSRDSSLLNLAMIPGVGDFEPTAVDTSSNNSYGYNFVDFPNDETNPPPPGGCSVSD